MDHNLEPILIGNIFTMWKRIYFEQIIEPETQLIIELEIRKLHAIFNQYIENNAFIGIINKFYEENRVNQFTY